MKKQLVYFLALIVLITCSENPTESNNNEVETGTIRDVEGHVYKVVKIGKQWWMAENLRATQYRNRDWIINVTGSNSWSENHSTGAYCNYDNDYNNAATYGMLYNWYTVVDGRNIAPPGWHVPTDEDWQKLENYLGKNTIAGGKMKSTGTVQAGDGLWEEPNNGATNESGFTALPGGYRSWNGEFGGLGYSSYFWSSTETSSGTAYSRYMFNDSSNVHNYDSSVKQAGFSIRCVKD